jgi:antitoxin ParD1/3/4
MSTMNISLPKTMKSFIDEQVETKGYSTSSEYMRDLIRREQDRQHLRKLLLDGAASPLETIADDAHFQGLRERIKAHAKS